VTSLTLKITGDQGMFERASKALRAPRPLMKQIGVLQMSSAVNRLTQVLAQHPDGGVRSGRLMASIRAGAQGNGGNDTVFALSNDAIGVGSNLPYAAIRQFGGTILPKKPGGALAIPLVDALKRSGQSPLEFDLSFQPIIGGATGNVFGLLIDDTGEAGFGEDEPLYALARSVTQEGTPYLFVSEDDLQVIREDLWPQFLGLDN